MDILLKRGGYWLLPAVVALASPAAGQECRGCGEIGCVDCFVAPSVRAQECISCGRVGCRECFLAPTVDPLADKSMLPDDDRFAPFSLDSMILVRSDVDAGAAFRLDVNVPLALSSDFNLSALVAGQSPSNVLVANPFDPTGPALLVGFDSVLSSFELNLRSRKWPLVSPLVGLRAIQLDDELFLQEAGTTSRFLFSTRNQLFGLQLGSQFLLLEHNRWKLASIVKAGVFQNDSSVEAEVTDGSGTVSLKERFSEPSFAGEVQVTLVYNVTSRFLLRGGYQGLWLTGVTTIPEGESLYDNNVSYHGMFAGLEFNW